MRDMMEAADVTEVSNAAETAMDGAGAVEAAMEGVSASVAAGMTAAVSSPVPSTTVSAAVTAASDRDRRCESCCDKRARNGGCDDHCSKHGAVSSSAIHPQQC
jgi:hypothetical protein